MSKMKLKNKPTKHNVKDVEKTSRVECLCFNATKHIAVSFEYLTDDDRYNLNYFQGDVKAHLNAYRKLHELLVKINQSSWVELRQLQKYTFGGFETLPYSSIKTSVLKKAIVLTPDTKVFSFRFGSSGYRLLGFKADSCHTLYVVGFDFNHSAYDHGS